MKTGSLVVYISLTGIFAVVVFLISHFIDKGAGLFLGGLLTIVGIPVFILDAFGYSRGPGNRCSENGFNVEIDPVFASMPENIFHKDQRK